MQLMMFSLPLHHCNIGAYDIDDINSLFMLSRRFYPKRLTNEYVTLQLTSTNKQTNNKQTNNKLHILHNTINYTYSC